MKRPMLAVAALFVVGVLLGDAWPQPLMSLLTIALAVAGLGLISDWAAAQWGALAPASRQFARPPS